MCKLMYYEGGYFKLKYLCVNVLVLQPVLKHHHHPVPEFRNVDFTLVGDGNNPDLLKLSNY